MKFIMAISAATLILFKTFTATGMCMNINLLMGNPGSYERLRIHRFAPAVENNRGVLENTLKLAATGLLFIMETDRFYTNQGIVLSERAKINTQFADDCKSGNSTQSVGSQLSNIILINHRFTIHLGSNVIVRSEMISKYLITGKILDAAKSAIDNYGKESCFMNLCHEILQMTTLDLSMFFQCCFSLINDYNFSYFFEEFFKEQLEKYKSHRIFTAKDIEAGERAVGVVKEWRLENNMVTVHSEVAINMDNSVQLKIFSCNKSAISSIIAHLESKLSVFMFFDAISVNFVDFRQLSRTVEGAVSVVPSSVVVTIPILSPAAMPMPYIFNCFFNIMTDFVKSVEFHNCDFHEDVFPITEHEAMHFGSLTTLKIHNCRIKTVSENIKNLKGLKILKIDYSRMEKIPECIFETVGLVALRISHGRIATVPDKICQLTRLKQLSLSANRLEAIPESVMRMSWLEELYMDDNFIREIADGINNMNELQLLYLVRNDIRMSGTVFRMKSLKVLYIQNYEFRMIPGVSYKAVEKSNEFCILVSN